MNNISYLYYGVFVAKSGLKSGGKSGHPPDFPPDFPPEFGKPTRIRVKPPEFKIENRVVWAKSGGSEP